MQKELSTIAKNIKNYRNKLGISQDKLLNLADVTFISLAESHVSIHTWSELRYLTLDVYLCNYSKDNSDTCKRVFDEIINFFQPFKMKKRLVKR